MESAEQPQTVILSSPPQGDSVQVKEVGTIPGSIANTIGTGEHAKNSLVYLTIKWTFIVASGLIVLLTLNSWIFQKIAVDMRENVESVFNIFIPIITLALGYAFGRHEK